MKNIIKIILVRLALLNVANAFIGVILGTVTYAATQNTNCHAKGQNG